MSWFGWGAPAPGTQPLGTQPVPVGTHPGGLVAGSATALSATNLSGTYAAGELVEYHSSSQGSWIPAKVLARNPNGTYNLDCKIDVPPDKIRRMAAKAPDTGGGFAGAEFKAGDRVEYYSTSSGTWILAKVLAVNSKGTYNLDCKPDVMPDKVRRPVKSQVEPPPQGLLSGGNAGSNSAALGSKYPKPAMTAPVQLLRVRQDGKKWVYEVCQEGAEILERHGSRRIAVASICGLYRTGKSYLLNMLLERVQRGQPLFQVGGTTRACTEGLWLWGSADSDDEHSPLLAFLDCEGFGSTESDRTRDAQLLTLCALLSSVLVLNTKGALNEGLFNALALTCRFAEHIEERGNEASRPVLLWVLRDFMLELRDPAGRPISPDEYLEQQLHAAPTGGHDEARGKAATEVRHSLLNFFAHRGCATLVQPLIDEKQLQELEKVPYTSLRGEFRAGVEALRTQLIATCHSNPKAIGGQPLGCYSFVALVRQLVSALNENKVLSMKGAWETVQHGACGNLADELRAEASTFYRALSNGERITGGAQLPMTGEALYTILRDERRKMKAQWDERAVGDEAVRKEYWTDLKEQLKQEEEAVKQKNARLADQQLTEALKTWQDWLDDDAGAAAVGEQISCRNHLEA